MPRRRAHDSPMRSLLRDLSCAAALAVAIAAGLAGPRTLAGAPAAHAAAVAERLAPADTDVVVPAPAAAGAVVPAPAGPALYRDSLLEPVVVRSVGGVLEATLHVEMHDLPVPDTNGVPQTLRLRAFRLASTTDPAYRDARADHWAFRPRFPGPTFRVRRGDLVRIRLVNDLPRPTPRETNEVCIQPVPDSVKFFTITIPDVYQGCFHGFNYTNIHYHGMHVTPDSTSTVVGDDVLMVIAPGDTLQYSFRIPENQSPGTHWYHPHKHGSVAIQVTNGMAGAFIVEDPRTGLDSIVRHLGMREHLIAVQQVAERMGLIGHQGELDKSALLVNGQFRPTIYMAPGEVQRWRIVNENTTRTTKTFLVEFVDVAGADEPRLFDVARDGVQFAPVNYDTTHPDTTVLMAPGQRLDVFVRAPRSPGRHSLQVGHVAGAGVRSRDPTLPVDSIAGPGPDSLGVVIFDVVVDPARSGNTTLPASLPEQLYFLRDSLRSAPDTAIIVFTDSLNQQPSQFYLGSRLNPYQRFDDNSVFVPSDTNGRAMPMVLRETQTWKIVNNSQQLINHPFHIHTNPFQVDTVVYFPGDPFADLYDQLNAAARAGHPIWLDVLPLPQPLASTANARVKLTADTLFVGADTIAVPQTTPQTPVSYAAGAGSGIPNTAYAVITQRYDDFSGCRDGHCGPPTGYLVMHCHILGHEERGMMQVLQIVRHGEQVSPPEGHAGPHHGEHPPRPDGGHRERRQDRPRRHRH